MSYFVFLEFGNQNVIEFITRFRAALQNTKKSPPVHVTLRGPYKIPPQLEQLEEFAERLRGYGVKICNYGIFSTPSGYAVFLRAECSIFRELWDKPDYKVSLARIQPHITVFESKNRADAEAVRDFLKHENLLIHTYNIYLSVYRTRSVQGDLFGRPSAIPGGRIINEDLWRIPGEILDRAKSLGTRLSTSGGSEA